MLMEARCGVGRYVRSNVLSRALQKLPWAKSCVLWSDFVRPKLIKYMKSNGLRWSLSLGHHHMSDLLDLVWSCSRCSSYYHHLATIDFLQWNPCVYNQCDELNWIELQKQVFILNLNWCFGSTSPMKLGDDSIDSFKPFLPSRYVFHDGCYCRNLPGTTHSSERDFFCGAKDGKSISCCQESETCTSLTK